MARRAQRDTHVILLSANWQALFITATFLSWLSLVGATLLAFMQSGYISAGTWAFQITTWLLPVAFLVIGFALLGQYAPFGKRLFIACLAATIGASIFYAVDTLENRVWYTYIATQPAGAHDMSWWSAFGNEWTVMLIGLAVYAGGLYLATHKTRR